MPKDFWTPLINEVFVCAQENENSQDPYAVAVKKGSLVVGHVSRKISAVCSLFLRTGTITAIVRDSRQYSSDLLQDGLEVPCVLRFCGEVKNIDKVRKLRKERKDETCIQLRNYYWWIKCWRFRLIIANRQSLLLANISSYTVH